MTSESLSGTIRRVLGNLETDRLRLRPLTQADLPFLIQLHADERVARHLGTGKPRSDAETREWLAIILGWYEREQLGHLGVLLKSEDRVIGRCGLTCFELERGGQGRAFWGKGSAPEGLTVTPTIEVGYAFHPDWWGRGFATEAARLMRDEAFRARGESCLISVIRADNAGSIRVAEKNGFVDRGTLEFAGRPFRRYEITRSEWERL